ncbi:MAG: hypothetical protein ACP5P4_10580 [Steroidobacteraceae bacterium]
MRTRLLGSFLFVLIFWWLVLSFWWFTAPPQEALQRLTGAAALLPWARHLPRLKPTVFDFWRIQRDTVALWTGPLTLAWIALALFATALVWGIAYGLHLRREDRVSPSAPYRGVGITFGVLPAPAQPDRVEVSLDAPSKEIGELLERIDPLERAVLEDLLAMLATAGLSQTAATLERVERALKLPAPGLACIVEVSCDLSEIPSVRARALSSLQSWWALPPAQRFGVLLAAKHRGEALQWVPEMTGCAAASKLAREVLFALDGDASAENVWKKKGPFYLIEGGAPPAAGEPGAGPPAHPASALAHTAVTPESGPISAAEKKPSGLLEIFCRELPNLPLRLSVTVGSKGVVPMGWKKNGRLYLIEKSLGETLWHKLPTGLKEQFREAPSGPRSPVTRALLEVLHLEGWLVTKNGLDELEAKDALWVVKAGKIDLKGVIVVAKLPDHLMDQLPTEDSPFDMTILRPLFFASKNPQREHTPGEMLDRKELASNLESEIATAPSVARFNLDDMLGGLLRPAPSKSPPATANKSNPPAKKD